MANEGFRSAGTLFKVRISGAYVLIPSARSGSGLGGPAPRIETTPIDLTTTRTYVGDTPSPGDFKLKANFKPGDTVQTYLLNAWKNQTEELFQIVYSTGHISSFAALVSNFQRSFDAGQVVSADIDLTITGVITDP